MYSDADTLSGGLPHSEIPGSTIARISPGLFAACHVLHRLSVPRHPPDALTLRLSATPNGKNHRDLKPDTAGRSRQVRQILLLPAKPRPRPRFRRSEDTSSRDPGAPPTGQALTEHAQRPRARRSCASPDPATVTQLASSQLSINSMPRRPTRPPRQFLTLRRVRSPASSAARGIRCASADGGGDRNRTDDPLLAKQVLSQLSYTPGICGANTAPTGETDRFRRKGDIAPDPALGVCHANACRRGASSQKRRWWAREDLNLRPHAYQARFLTS